MLLTPQNCRLLAEGLDHPEAVALGPDGTLYAGGEAGQIYQIEADGQFREVASTGGFILGIALDAQGAVHACDCGSQSVVRVNRDGMLDRRSTGTVDHSFAVPNYCVFDANGNLYVSDSGDYWQRPGTGCIVRISPDNRTTMFHRGPFSFANGLAIDPTQQWLYVVQSTAANVVRTPLDRECGAPEAMFELPQGTVPDGLAFTEDGRLLISCYKPDCVYLGQPDGSIEVFLEDPTGELLSRPTNVVLGDGMLYVANLGGWHVTVVETDLRPSPLHYPILRSDSG